MGSDRKRGRWSPHREWKAGRGRKGKLVLVPFAVAAAMMALAISAYACTNYVGLMQVWGNNTGGCTGTAPDGSCTTASGVIVTGNDSWNGPGAMTQSVNATTSKANKYVSSTNLGNFYVEAEVSGTNSLNQGSTNIWYDVNTVPVGYTNHTTWGGTNAYDCMSWALNQDGVWNVGSVQINTHGMIIAAASGTQGTGTSLTLFSDAAGIAGPWNVSSNETSANTSPQESGVCLSDATSNNGNEAPLQLV